MKMRALTVRATVTNRVAPNETIKLLDIFYLWFTIDKKWQSSRLQRTNLTSLKLLSISLLAKKGHKDFGIR
jgi:hypothetical protein